MLQLYEEQPDAKKLLSEDLQMTAPKDIKDIAAVTHQQQMLLITKLLSKGMSVSGSNSFDALLSASSAMSIPRRSYSTRGCPFNHSRHCSPARGVLHRAEGERQVQRDTCDCS